MAGAYIDLELFTARLLGLAWHGVWVCSHWVLFVCFVGRALCLLLSSGRCCPVFFCLFLSCLVFAVFSLGLGCLVAGGVLCRLVSGCVVLFCLVLFCVVLCCLVFLVVLVVVPFVVSLFAAASCQVPTSTWRSSRRGCLAWFAGMGQSGPVGFSVCFFLLVPSGCCFFFCLFSSCICDVPAAVTAYVSPNSKGLSDHMLLQPRDHPLQPPESRLTKTSCCEELALWKLAPAVIDTMKQP